MYKRLAKIYYVGQVAMSVAIIAFGASYSIRCLLSKQIFCAVCFAVMGLVSGYLLMFRSSIKELREHNAKQAQGKSYITKPIIPKHDT